MKITVVPHIAIQINVHDLEVQARRGRLDDPLPLPLPLPEPLPEPDPPPLHDPLSVCEPAVLRSLPSWLSRACSFPLLALDAFCSVLTSVSSSGSSFSSFVVEWLDFCFLEELGSRSLSALRFCAAKQAINQNESSSTHYQALVG